MRSHKYDWDEEKISTFCLLTLLISRYLQGKPKFDKSFLNLKAKPEGHTMPGSCGCTNSV